MVNPSEHTIKCDLCQREFRLNKDVLREVQVTLMKAGLEPHEVTATFLTCPACGKQYPVIVDDETTLPLLAKLRVFLGKQVKQAQKGFKLSPEQERKRKELNRKLDFKRQELAKKYNGSFYQLEDGIMEQLDYRYHAR